jgi:hypothetical protein
MALTQLAPPYPIFTDKSGSPLDNGYLYFGEVNKNPETNPIQVYYDSAFTQPAAQPLRTSNGYVMRNGSPALIYANSAFSVTVRNKKQELVVYLSSFKWEVGEINTSQLIGQLDADRIDFTQAGAGAVLQTVQDKLEESVSVLDFGAVGDGVADDTTAFTNAGAGAYVPEGTYLVDTSALDVWDYSGPGIIKTETGQFISLQSPLSHDRIVQKKMMEPFLGFDNGTTNTEIFDGALRTSQGMAYANFGGSDKVYLLQPVVSAGSFNSTVITAGSFATGTLYEIVSAGTTDFTLIGAANNTVGTRFTATGAGTGTGTAAVVESQRIVEYTLADDGSVVSNDVFTGVLNLGHQGLSALVDGSSLYLYTQYVTQPTYRGVDGGKGFAKILWDGASTSSITNYQLFGYSGSGHPFEEYYGATSCASTDGRYIVLVANTTKSGGVEDTSNTLFVYDRIEVETAANPLDVRPVYSCILEIEGRHQRASATQGVASDGQFAYVYRGFYMPLGYSCIQKYDFYGKLVATIFVDGPRAQYGREGLLDNATLGIPASFEPEGMALNGSQILLLAMDYFKQAGSIVSYKGSNFSAINDNNNLAPDAFGGDDDWVRTTKAASGAWEGYVNAGSFTVGGSYKIEEIGTTDFTLIGAASNTVGLTFTATGVGSGTGYATRNYAAGANYTKRSKVIYAVQPEVGDVGEEPVDAAINNIVSGASIASLANAVDFSAAQGNTIQFTQYSENTGEYVPVVYFSRNGFITQFFDTRADSTPDRISSIASRHEVLPLQRDMFEIRADQTIANGGAINLYGKDDAVNPNTVRFYGGENYDNYIELVEDVSQPFFAPSAASSGTINLGGSGRLWDTVYAATGTINTSDERAKQDISSIDDAERRVALAIKGMMKKYRLKASVEKKGTSARTHFGVIAQDVKAAFEAEGLDPSEYGLFCHDEWEEVPAIDGEQNGSPEGDRYGIRYEELFAFIIAAL